jgi:tight adherence protein C
MDHAHLLQTKLAVLAFGTAVGLSVGLVAWLLASSIASTEADDRRYKDRLPLGFRTTWWLVLWLSLIIRPLLSQARLDTLATRLRKAGLEFTLEPAQFVAGRLLCAGVFGLFVWWVARAWFPSAQAGRWIALAALCGFLGGWAYPAIWLKDRLARTRLEIQKALPFYLDIITLCVEAGLNLSGALKQAAEKGPHGMLRNELLRVLRDIRAGSQRAAALRRLSDRLQEPGVTSFISAVIQAESMGVDLGPVLRAQADQRRSERFLRAEKLAMEAPVKMLFPLIAFIFPCTFIVLLFPIAMKLMHSGL